MDEYLSIRDSIQERLIASPLCAADYRKFLRCRKDVSKLVDQLVHGIRFMLENECISEAELMRVLEDTRFDMTEAYGAIVAWAVKTRREAFLDWFLVRGGLEPHLPEAVYWAAKSGFTEILAVLIKHGADVKAWDSAPLRYAAANGRLEAVKMLIAAGADPAAADHGAIKYARQNSHDATARYLSAL